MVHEPKPAEVIEGVDVAFSGSAPFSNKIQLSLTPVTARISFMEAGPDGVLRFRTAVSMVIDDLIALRNLIDETLEKQAQQNRAQSGVGGNGDEK